MNQSKGRNSLLTSLKNIIRKIGRGKRKIKMKEKGEKQKLREKIWKAMERKEIAKFPRPVFGRIPNFENVKKATENLCDTPEYKKAQSIFTNPDSPQQSFREKALHDGKKIIMATPGIRKGFLKLDPSTFSRENYRYASTIKGSFKFGETIHPSELQIDLFMAGSVAVSKTGGRLGKGKGYTDLEYGILREWKAFSQQTICTTVHEIQIIESLPMNRYDLPVDLIGTPQRVIRTHTQFTRPVELNWDLISQERMQEISLLQEVRRKKE